MTDKPSQPGQGADLSAQLAALRAIFSAQLTQSFAELNALVQGSAPRPDVLEQLHARLHKLAGSGGTFGFPALSARASALARQLHAWQQLPMVAVPEWLDFCDQVRALDQTVQTQVDAVAAPAEPEQAAMATQQADVRVLLIHAQDAVRHYLSREIGQFGYEVRAFAQMAEALDAVQNGTPVDAVLLELSADASPLLEALNVRSTAANPRVPVLLLSAAVTFAEQLQASRLGGDDLLPDAADAPTVATRIDRLLRERDHSPCRVLIVDDDDVLAEHYCLVLRAAGMLAERISAPADLPLALERLRPDVLLMDLYMPEYQGTELARAIRYQEAWQGLPIVYLSAEADRHRQIEAMGDIADDFLLKPIPDAQLVAITRSRALRARKLVELMSQDSLTGLLKHASIKERLAQELDRARRLERPMSVVMVDIDFFKRINDTHGHPMGDQVIKALGHLLQQRLRRHDSVGRYGGEEFMALLPDCAAGDALRVMEDIRQRFSEIRFAAGDEGFRSTLSAGVASTETHRSPQSLLAAADAALYQAKRNGRNQVRQVDLKDPQA